MNKRSSSIFKITLRKIIIDIFKQMRRNEYITVSAFMIHFNSKISVISDVFLELEREGWFDIHNIEVAQYYYRNKKNPTKIYIKR